MRLLTSFLLFIAAFHFCIAQDIHFEFDNAQITNDGSNDFYEVDVLISSSSDFKLGSGQIYLNYNPLAFGANISANGKLTYDHGIFGGSYILDQQHGGTTPIYSNFIQNDNTGSRVSISFQQALGEGSITNNVSDTPSLLLHIKIEYQDATLNPMLCFESTEIFLDQFYSACGPGTAGLPKDCATAPGAQITNDTYDCAGALVCFTTTEYTGTWSNSNPASGSFAIISADYTTSLDGGSIDACSLSVSSGATLRISAGDYVKLYGNITVDSGGILIVEHEGSVVQVDSDAIVTNNGTINVLQTTPNLASRDFMILGSPMSGEMRNSVWNSAFLVLDATTANFVPHPDVAAAFPGAENFADDNNDFWGVYSGTLDPGEGYLVRPQSGFGQPGGVFNYTYDDGTLNTGDVTFSVGFNTDKNSSPNVLANPYASSIFADDFISANSMIDEVYFWEHLTPPSPGLPGAGAM
ncbi:MAG: hypothetical protein AAFP76_10215, partial [Bacteroidota bacterium]